AYPDKAAVAAELSRILKIVDASNGDCPATLFADHSNLSRRGRKLVQNYKSYDETARAIVNRRIVDEVFSGAIIGHRELRLKRLYGELHRRAKARGKDEERPGARTALCISGGGIRSATFALGVLQGLARQKILTGFDYLSTVSGGGYVGSWLSSWARRHPEGIAGVQKDLAGEGAETAASKKLEPEPAPVRHLREYSNYMTPRLGLLSADGWTMASLYVRNVLLNLLVLVPILAAALAFPRLAAHLVMKMKGWHPLPFGIVAVLTIAFGFFELARSRPLRQGGSAARKGSDEASFVFFCILPLVAGAFLLSLFWAGASVVVWTQREIASIIAALVVAMAVLPAAVYFVRFLGTSAAERRQSLVSERQRLTKAWQETGAAIVAALAAAVLFYLVAVKLFPRPIADVPWTASMHPLLRLGLPKSPTTELYVTFGVPLIMLILFVQASIFTGLSSRVNEDYDREWWGRGGAWLFIAAAGWAAVAAISIFGPVALYQFPVLLSSVGGLSGLFALIVGWSGKTPGDTQKEATGAAGAVTKLASGLAVPLFVVFLLAAISLGTTAIIQLIEKPRYGPDRVTLDSFERDATMQTSVKQQNSLNDYQVTNSFGPVPRVSLPALRGLAHLELVHLASARDLSAIGFIALIAVGLSYFVGANKFSMQALYRNRLIRAYLGASRYDRDPDLFTGFDPYDNLSVHELRPELLWPNGIKDINCFARELLGVGARKHPSLSPWIQARLTPSTEELLQNVVAAAELHGLRDASPLTAVTTTTLTTLGETSAAIRKASVRLTKAASKNGAVISKAIDDAVEDLLPSGSHGAAVEALAEDLNTIIETHPDREQLIAQARLDDVTVPELKKGDHQPSVTVQNRQALDRVYAEIVPMPRARTAEEANGARAPLHVVNIALNLVSGENLAWQQRMAETFTVSPLHSGSAFLGFRESREYGHPDEGISLGSAVAISGAAASPNMGYHSSP
ncbi:MAG: rane protein of unknown function, contains domain, partial [Acidobacteria bacterium]|nr:rane protein of unknown function, contains domain [Acidobacteriota bacterium]